MTKCVAYWEKVRSFKEKDDFEGFCGWCGAKDKSHLYEDWKIVEVYEKLQICNSDITKVPADAIRPLIRKSNEVFVPKTLKKIESFVKGGKEPITRKKVEEFMFGKNHTHTPPKRKLVPCANCGVATSNPTPLGGLNFCSEKCSLNVDEIKKRLNKASMPLRTEKREYKPLETGEYKRARMKVATSKFELRVEKKLELRKLPMGERNGLITLPFLFADRVWELPNGILVWRANGIVHKGKEDKAVKFCEALRTLGVHVVETWYERDCEKSAEEAVQQIVESLKEMGWNGQV